HDSSLPLENVAVHARKLKEQVANLLKIFDQKIDTPDQNPLGRPDVLPEVHAQHDNSHRRAAYVSCKPLQFVQALVILEESEWLRDFVHNCAENEVFDSENDDGGDIADRIKYALRDVVLGPIQLAVLTKHNPIKPYRYPGRNKNHAQHDV